MGKKLLLSVIVLLFAAVYVSAENVDFGSTELNVTVLESNDSRTVIDYEIGTFEKEAVEINGEIFYQISCINEHILNNKGEPALPRISRSIIIPDDAEMEIRVLSAEYVEFENIPVAPSKGIILRNQNPEDVPFTFGEVYQTDSWSPIELVSIREPHIQRDYRGTVVDLNAFQYNHQLRTLRVCNSIRVEVVNVGPGRINVFDRPKESIGLISDFEIMYERRYVNYQYYRAKYTPIEEVGDMLIITHDSFHDAVVPLVDWKLQKGMLTTLVDISTIGNNSTAIKNYIQNAYTTNPDLAFVLLVGDHAQVATYLVSGAASDPSYAKVVGTDDYPDILIGRFSAEAVAQAETQVERSINYEKIPVGVDWFHMGTGIASSQGAGIGHNGGEADNVHMDKIRDSLLSYNYTHVDQIYDPSGTASQVATALNEGRSIINYCGHGSTTSWSSTGFSNSHVNALVNNNMLPLIISVACVNGDFDGPTCFGEAWLRATNSGVPTGAIGAYMSSINQSWAPPMDAQDEAVHLLIQEYKLTTGGLCFNGSCKMIDINGIDGVEMSDTWHLFGDPSIMIRTLDPIAMTVNHSTAHIFTLPTMDVQVPGLEGALCAVYHNGTLYGSAYTDAGGNASIAFEDDLPIGEDVTLTVTAYNMMPYIGSVTIIAPDGPFIVQSDNDVNDTYGNNDGLVNYGESILLGMELQNVGPDVAYNVSAVISTTDTFVTITDDNELYGEIPGDFGVLNIADAFAFDVEGYTPDEHIIEFELAVTGSDTRDTTWTSNFSIPVYSPALTYVSISIDDATGNGNGILDPGETGDVVITIENLGSADAYAVTGTITEDDPDVTILDDAGTFGDIYGGGDTGDNSSDVFTVSADAATPMGHLTQMQLILIGSYGYSATIDFNFVVGDRVAFFFDDFSFDQGWTGLGGSGEWTIGPAVGGSGSDGSGGPDPDTDHTPSSDNFVLGNDLTAGSGGDYNSNLSSTYWITSPMFDLSGFSGVQMTYWHWLGVESPTYDHAYLQVYNGSSWVTLYENDGSINEQEWTKSFYDLSSYADGNMDFQIRFGIGTSDGSVQYCGWNIDDIELKGYGEIPSGSPEMVTSPTEIDDSLFMGDSYIDTVKAYNTGETLLRSRFSSSEGWLSFDTEQHNIPAGDSLILPVTLNSAGLIPGDYYGAVQYTCNDPLNASGSIPVHMHIFSPDIQVSETEINETVQIDQTTEHDLYITNDGPGRLDYSITRLMFNGKRTPVAKEALIDPLGYRASDPEKSTNSESEPYYPPQTRSYGGPDTWGYNWVDSDEPDGPLYEWIDITSVGIAIDSIGDDDTTAALPIGFSFPYYENYYDELYIGSNGIITFGLPSKARTNVTIPTTTVPNNMIALWWDDLDPRYGGQIYYYSDIANNRFIVTFDGIPNYYSTTGTGSLTFQAIFYTNGKIKLQYGVMDPGADYSGLTGSTIGIENSAGADGLEVVFNAEYMHNNLAILFTAASWLSVDPGSGSVDPFSADTINVGFDASDMEEGEYDGMLTIASNDPDTPSLDITINFTVSSDPQAPPSPTLVYPENNASEVAQPITFSWDAVSGADMYQMQIDTNATFSGAKMDSSMTETACTVEGLGQGLDYFWRVRAQNSVGWGDWSEVRNFATEVTWICGDVDNGGSVNILDVTDLISYLYKDGDPPVYMEAADVDGNGSVNILDITRIIAFLYQGGGPLNCL